MKRKQIAALLLSLIMIFSLFPKNIMADEALPESNAIANFLPISPVDIASNIVAGGAKSIGEIAIGNLLSVFGFKKPEEQFREQVEQSLSDIQKSITDCFGSLSSQIADIESQLTDLQDYMLTMKQELFARIDHSEFDSRMTVINQYSSKVDAIYEEYERLSNEKDFDVAKSTAIDIIAKISDADLPTVISYLSSEYISTEAGSRTPMVSLYLRYLKDVYPFLHQYYTPYNNYAQYCELELTRAALLYIEYCSYMQTANADDAATVTVWYNNAASALKKFIDTIDTIELQLPKTEYTLTEDNKKFHIVNEDYGISIWFDPSDLKNPDDMYYFEREDFGPDDEYYYEHGNVRPEMYNKLKELQKKFSPASSTLQFINDNTGANVTSSIWGCITSNPCGVDIFGPQHTDGYQVYSLSGNSDDDGEGDWRDMNDDCVKAWTGELPVYEIPETNSINCIHTAVYAEAVAPTCMNTGLTEGVYCSDCGEWIMEQKEVPATGHIWGEWKVTKEATETEKGIETRICKNDSSHKETRDIPKKTHVHSVVKVKAKAATLTSAGNIAHYKCSVCGKLFKDKDGKTVTTAKAVTIAKLININKATISGISSKTYTGKVLTQNPKVVINGVTLKKNTDYKVAFRNNTNAGKATVTITGVGKYGGSLSRTFTINKASNPLTTKTASKTYKQTTLTTAKAFTIGASKNQGKVTYTPNAAAKKAKIKVTAKGKVTIPKTCKKGTYKITVKAAGNKNYKAGTKTVTIKIK